jgi:hypothetical protein
MITSFRGNDAETALVGDSLCALAKDRQNGGFDSDGDAIEWDCRTGCVARDRGMKQRGFDENHPIDVAEINGRQIIVDGYHRARAAGQAGIKDVRVRVNPVTPQQADQLYQEADEASLFRES